MTDKILKMAKMMIMMAIRQSWRAVVVIFKINKMGQHCTIYMTLIKALQVIGHSMELLLGTFQRAQSERPRETPTWPNDLDMSQTLSELKEKQYHGSMWTQIWKEATSLISTSITSWMTRRSKMLMLPRKALKKSAPSTPPSLLLKMQLS